MKRRAGVIARWGPRLALAFTFVAVVAGFLLPQTAGVEAVFNRIFGLAFAVVGFLAARASDGRRIGWLCLAIGATAVAFDVLFGYAATRGPGAVWAYWAGNWVSQVQPVLTIIVLPAVFPTGRSLGPRWRWLVPTSFVVLAMAVLSSALDPDDYEIGDVALGSNPVPFEGTEVVIDVLFLGTLVGGLVCVVAALLSIALRFRRSGGVERQQLRWLFAGVVALAVFVAIVMAAFAAGLSDGVVVDSAMGIVMLSVPVAIGVALTRYRLYDLDRLISRTVAYTLLLALLAATYLGLVVTLGAGARAVTGESGDLVVALSTLAVAAMFQPLRRRLRTVVDRRFNRARYDADRTVEAFGRGLRDQVSLEAVVGELARTAGGAIHPRSVGVVLLERAGGTR